MCQLIELQAQRECPLKMVSAPIVDSVIRAKQRLTPPI